MAERRPVLPGGAKLLARRGIALPRPLPWRASASTRHKFREHSRRLPHAGRIGCRVAFQLHRTLWLRSASAPAGRLRRRERSAILGSSRAHALFRWPAARLFAWLLL